MKSIILFDMDGTLTPPRRKIEKDVIAALEKKSKDFDIGIVTGSDFDYVMQQCNDLFKMSSIDPSSIHIFPCNGTKRYLWKYTKYELDHSADMIEKIGESDYRKVLHAAIDLQSEIMMFYTGMPLTGTFFQYRGTLLNWCPIGRIANQDQREAWKKLDKDFDIRTEYMQQLQACIDSSDIDAVVALGGSTSFDIYPAGWDKTYVMRHLDNYDKVFFIGDKCREGGNDKALFDLLSSQSASFETSCPRETIDIMSKISL